MPTLGISTHRYKSPRLIIVQMGDFDTYLLTNWSGDHFLQKMYFSPVKIVNLRGEGDFDRDLLTDFMIY